MAFSDYHDFSEDPEYFQGERYSGGGSGRTIYTEYSGKLVKETEKAYLFEVPASEEIRDYTIEELGEGYIREAITSRVWVGKKIVGGYNRIEFTVLSYVNLVWKTYYKNAEFDWIMSERDKKEKSDGEPQKPTSK